MNESNRNRVSYLSRVRLPHLIAELAETNVHIFNHLVEYSKKYDLPTPTSAALETLMAQIGRTIREMEDLSDRESFTSPETELLQLIREDCKREPVNERVEGFLKTLPPELATRLRHLLYWTVYKPVQAK